MQYLYAFLKKAEFLSFYFDEKDEQLQQKLPQFLHVHHSDLQFPFLLFSFLFYQF